MMNTREFLEWSLEMNHPTPIQVVINLLLLKVRQFIKRMVIAKRCQKIICTGKGLLWRIITGIQLGR